MASFILDEETGVTVKEPVILIDKLLRFIEKQSLSQSPG